MSTSVKGLYNLVSEVIIQYNTITIQYNIQVYCITYTYTAHQAIKHNYIQFMKTRFSEEHN